MLTQRGTAADHAATHATTLICAYTHLILCLTGHGLIIFIDNTIIVCIRTLFPGGLGSEDPEEDTNDNILT